MLFNRLFNLYEQYILLIKNGKRKEKKEEICVYVCVCVYTCASFVWVL